jgi:MYXO-CTERM domain-containing protein
LEKTVMRRAHNGIFALIKGGRRDMFKILVNIALGIIIFACSTAPAKAVIIVTPTTDPASLAAALNPTGLTIDSIVINNGAAGQFGTYTNFTTPPITFAPGVVLSSGLVAETPGPSNPGSLPSTATGAAGTAEFNAYGPGNITNFNESFNVAAMQVNFTLPTASPVSFDFVFGSIEFPVFTSQFTDAFLVFLDGMTNQVSFDSNGNPVQVGMSFADLVTTADLNTAFANPHGLIQPLSTTTMELGAGPHTLLFEVGDVNDQILDSAAFIANLRASSACPPGSTCAVPEPASSLPLLGASLIGLGGLAVARRRRWA